MQDDFYSDESRFEKPDFDKPRSEEPRSEKPRDEQPRSERPREQRRRDENPFGSAFGSANPFGPGSGNDFGELRDAGESFLKGLSDFINDRVDRRTDGSGNRPGGRANGYGTFGNPDVGDEHPEGTSHQDKDTEDKLGEFTEKSWVRTPTTQLILEAIKTANTAQGMIPVVIPAMIAMIQRMIRMKTGMISKFG